MTRLIFIAAFLCLQFYAAAQTAVNLSAQPNYTYTEGFTDITNWTFNISGDGTFTSGIGAAAWRGNNPAGSGGIPNGTTITHQTTSFQTVSGPGSSSGIYKQSQSIGLLSTGTTNNTSSVAFDLFVNFTGLNAGTLSFDWASLNNSTGDRKSSMKVYTSTDGISFTELTGAAVLNFTNNSPTSGQISFIQLPASFNNSATAQIRFYYYNGTGGTTGSRPKLQLDNVKVTGTPTAVCAAPTAQPTSLVLSPGFSTVSGSFTAASPAPHGYLVIRSINSSLSSLPVNGVNYNIGDNVGDGTVVAYGTSTSFNGNGLSASTQYYYFIFSVNYLCTGGPLYLTASPLTGSTTTLSGSSPCSAPADQPTNLILSNITSSSIKGNFTASVSGNADHYLIVRSTSQTLSSNPVNGTQYYPSSNLGGGVVVTKTPLTNFTANGLASGTTYYFFVFAVNEDNCINGPAYNTVSPITSGATTISIPVCTTPGLQPSNLELTATNNTVNGFFAPKNADGYLVVYSTSSVLATNPQNGINYTPGTILGNGTVLSNGTAASFIATNLNPSTTYYFFVFSKSDQCTGGPMYLTTNPASMLVTTSATAPYGYYFGNLHAHSAYSDGNQDNPSFTPANDYAYAKNSMCMDFLGISEHNHSEAGMALSKYALGRSAAAAATTSSFLAMYGMEWGVISNGGHVLVYGIDQLIGWEAGNYNVFVPKSDYIGKPSTTGTTGLFKTINDWPSTAFAMLAHPDNHDFNDIANIAFLPGADSAVAGCAVESGPATSTNTSYTDPASRLSTYWYFKKLLSRGYHVGPNIDHDNHYTTFGRTNYSRLAVISPSLTEAAFLQSMKSRSFYATHDCDVRVSFTLNNQPMGSSTVTHAIVPSMSVYAYDPTSPAAIPKIRIMFGVPGSLVEAVPLDSVNANVFNFTDYNLPIGSWGYYYAEVIINGGYAITSPIWYYRNTGVSPVTMLSFSAAVNNKRTVDLQWRTVNETNNKMFIIERSADGVTFKVIDSVAGKNSLSENYYSAEDKYPFAGYNYYRLKQVDNDGKFTYSNTVAVNLSSAINTVVLYPNPAKAKLLIDIITTKKEKGALTIMDAFGRIVKAISTDFEKGQQQKSINVEGLSAGTYFITITAGEEKILKQFIKQ